MASPAPRKILLVVTTGGFTHAAPVLEIGAVLAARGHEIQFATLEGQESWTRDYPFITTIHIVGPNVPEADTDAHYERMRHWRADDPLRLAMDSKTMFDSYWTNTYRKLKQLCGDKQTRPDFIIADFFEDSAAKDMLKQFNVQCAIVCPQMPQFLAPASYIPGQPGFQTDLALTSEHATLGARFRNELVIVWALPVLLKWVLWTKRMRADAGVHYPLRPQSKPDHLVFVNSFFGIEVPKDLPPTMAAVGPILSDKYPPLSEDTAAFLERNNKSMYVSLGTHVNLPAPELDKLLRGFIKALDAGHINGVIWSVPVKPRANFDPSKTYTRADGSIIHMSDLLADSHPQFRLPTFAPQRAILDHPHLRLFLSHSGGSSANEAVYHGVPVLSIGYFFDQVSNSERLRQAGVSITLDKFTFTPDAIASSIAEIRTDKDGNFARNVLRMQRIATVASRRKHLAADLIEEVMYDQELRFKDGVALRPMHLQTADMRMPFWKVRNWDMWFVGMSSVAVTGVACWWAVREGWKKAPTLLGRLGVVTASFVALLKETRPQGWNWR